MTSSSVARRVSSLMAPALAFLLAAGCSSGRGITVGAGGSSSGGTTTSGGTTGSGGTTASGGTTSNGGTTAIGGTNGNGGTTTSGGTTSNGGTTATGGTAGRGGTTGKGGTTGTGGEATSGGVTGSGGNPGGGGAGKGGTPGSGGTGKGGTLGSGGTGKGGTLGSGGVGSTGGATGAGGQTGAGGATMDGGTSTTTIDCTAAMPTGGQQHSGNSQGGAGNLAWQIWSNQNTGTLTTFGDTPAFSAAWNNSGDFLARLGFQWGDSGKTYDAYGTITAQYAYNKKTGTGGSYSYIGIYGTSPCIEWYIVDDSFNSMPVHPSNATDKGSVVIDDGTYILYTLQTSGGGGPGCSGSSWMQYYSVRKTARQCGQISITKHFDAWKAAGMTLGNLQEARIVIEAGGGSGSIDFPIANITAQ